MVDALPVPSKEIGLKGTLVLQRFSEFQYESEDDLEDKDTTMMEEDTSEEQFLNEEDNYEKEDLHEEGFSADLRDLMLQLDLSSMKLAVEASIREMGENEDRERAFPAPTLDQPLPVSTDVTTLQASQYYSVIDTACTKFRNDPRMEKEAMKWAQLVIPAWRPCFAEHSTNVELLSTIAITIAQLLQLCRVGNRWRPIGDRLEPLKKVGFEFEFGGIVRWCKVLRRKRTPHVHWSAFSWLCWELQCYYPEKCLPEFIITSLLSFVESECTVEALSNPQLQGVHLSIHTALDVIRQASFYRRTEGLPSDPMVFSKRATATMSIISRITPTFMITAVERPSTDQYALLTAAVRALDCTIRNRSGFLSNDQHTGLLENMGQLISTLSPSKWRNDLDLKLCTASLLVMAELVFDSEPRKAEEERKVILDILHFVASCCFPQSARFLHRSLNSAAFRVLGLALRRLNSCTSNLVDRFASEGVFLSALLHSNILQKFYPNWLLFNAETAVDAIKKYWRAGKESILGLLPNKSLKDLNSSVDEDDGHYMSDSWSSCFFTSSSCGAFNTMLKLVLPLQDDTIPKNHFRARHLKYLIQVITTRDRKRTQEPIETYLFEHSLFKVADGTETAPVSASYAMLLRVGIQPRAAINIIRMLSQHSESKSWSFDKLFSLTEHLIIQCAAKEQVGRLQDLLRNSYSKKQQILGLFRDPQGWWKAVAIWQAESSVRLQVNHLSLAVAVCADRSISKWNFPKWLMELVCYQPYPSIENLLFTIDPNQLVKPHWEIDGKRYELRATQRFRDFVAPGAQSLPPYQSFEWVCLPQHDIKDKLQAGSILELGAQLQQLLEQVFPWTSLL
jgi:hypothetical protein